MNKCRKCGKELDGLSWSYGFEWLCSNCAEDKTSVLYCERGCKVITKHLGSGSNMDAERAKKYLKNNKEYTTEKVAVGGFSSSVLLKEIPGVWFNSVHFERVV